MLCIDVRQGLATLLMCHQAEDWFARQQAQDSSQAHPANGYTHSAIPDIEGVDDTNGDGEEAEPAHQPAPTAAAHQPNGVAHQYTNGHVQQPVEAQLRHSDSSESEEEDGNDGQEEEEDGAEAVQVQCTFTFTLFSATSEYVLLCHAIFQGCR